MEKYTTGITLGQGNNGWVYRAYNSETNEIVAVKRIDMLDESVPSSFIREISFLKEMDHTNIVRLLDVVARETIVYIVMEYMHYDLKKFMDSYPRIAKHPKVIKNLLHQLLRGLAYCHSHEILHRDLKPKNLLIDSSHRILKLADFGSAREIGVPLGTYTDGEEVATPWYRAPELLLGDRKYSTPVDMWSVGCIFAEMVNQQPLFNEPNEYRQVIKLFSIMGKPNEETWPGVTSLFDYLDSYEDSEPKNMVELVPGLEQAGVDLLSQMLCLNPKGRITAFDALKHPYFDYAERR